MDLPALRRQALGYVDKARPAVLLLGRLAVGLVFVPSGLGKLMHPEGPTKFFTELGIPAPHLNVLVSGSAELFCGLALCVGALTRLAAIPLVVTMIVAIVTAKKDAFAKASKSGDNALLTLVGFDEFTYIAFLLVFVVVGPGKWAVDHLLAKKLGGADDAADKA